MSFLKKIFVAIFGEVSYKSPAWVQKISKKLVYSALFILLALLASVFFYNYLNKGLFLEARVYLDENIYILNSKGETSSQKGSNLRIHFRLNKEKSDSEKVADEKATFAALKLNNEVVKKGISASPDLGAGIWRWQGNNLVFEPANPWVANKTYKLKLDKSLFNPLYKFDEEIKFNTPDFHSKIQSLEIYSSPTDPKTKVLSATVLFNYPVANQDFSKIVQLKSKDEIFDNLKLEFKLNKFGNKLFIKSEKLRFTKKEHIVSLEVANSVKTLDGNSIKIGKLRKNIAIPSVHTFFRIANMQTKIINDVDDNPRQNILLDFTDAVEVNQIADKIEAYFLPRNKYWSGEEVLRALNVKDKKATGALDLKKLEKVSLQINSTPSRFSKFVSFGFSKARGGQMLVKIPAGLKSISDFELGIGENRVLDIASLPRQIKIQGRSWLALNNVFDEKDKKIVVKSFGVNRLNGDLVKLNRKDLVQVLTQTRGRLSDLDFINYSFNEENIGEHHKIKTQVYSKNIAEAAYTSLDLSPYLASNPTGFFIFSVSGSYNDDWQTQPTKKLVFVTNLGLIAKNNSDNSHTVYAHSLATNDKVASARIRVLSKSGKEVYSTFTDSSGAAKIANLSKLSGSDEPVVYLIEKDGDLAFLPFSRFDRQIEYKDSATEGFYSNYTDRLRAFIFTDRGIYRPGENVKVGVAVKNKEFSSLISQFVNIIVKDSDWNEVFRRKAKLDETGFFDFNFKTQLNQITGDYTVVVKESKSERTLGEQSFLLEEFSPATMKLKTNLNLEKKAWLLPNNISFDANLQTLYGFAVENHKIDSSYILEEMDFSFKEYPDFVFKNTLDENQKLQSNKREKLSSMNTDKSGNAKFEFGIDKLSAGLYALLIKTTALDDTNTLEAKNLVLVSAYEKLVGFKTGANLTRVKKDVPLNLELLMIDRKLDKIKDEKLDIRIYQKRKVSSLVKQENGNLAYQFVDEEKFVEKSILDFSKNSKINLPTEKSGDFVIKAENATGALVLQLDYSVLKEDGSKADSENLVVNLAKKTYEVGETAQISLNAPYSGLALITLEREKVLKHKWVKINAGKQSVDFALPSEIKGSAYINTLLVRSLAEENKISEPLSYAINEIFINPRAQKISIDLQAPKKIRAGDELVINYKTDKKSKILIYGVDEGILQVAKYKTPKPLDFFYAKRALEVRTQQMADLIMPGLKIMLGMPSGAGADMMLEKKALYENFDAAKSLADSSLNPLLRQVKAPVAFWSGVLDANTNSKNYSVRLPKNFTGKLRIIAFAANETSLGSKDTGSLSIAPLILASNGVNYLAEGDSAEFSLSLRNGDAEEAKKAIEVSLSSSDNLEIIDFKAGKFDLTGGAEKIFKFKVKAKKSGVANLGIIAKYKDYKAEETRSISIRPSNKYELQLSLGLSNREKIKLNEQAPVDNLLAKSQVFVSKNMSPILEGLNAFLEDFEHDCTEQLVSKIYPLISLNKNALFVEQKFDETTKNKNLDYKEKYDKLLDILLTRKNYDGSFANWSNGSKGSNLVSLYVINFLLDAKEAGLDTKGLDSNNSAFLHKIVKESKDAYETAYAIYLLSRQKVNVYSYLADYQKNQDEKFKDWHKNLTGAYIAAAWALLGNNEYEDFVKNYDWSAQIYSKTNFDAAIGFVDMNRYYIAENAQYVYLLAKHFPHLLEKTPAEKLEMLLLPLAKGKLNTLTAGFTSIAFNSLEEFGVGFESSANSSIKVLAKGKELGKGKDFVKLEKNNFLTDLEIINDQKTWLFYTQKTLGFKKSKESFNKGIEVSRSFFDLDGNAKTNFKQGEEIEVKLKVRSTDGKMHHNVVLTDMLAGGLSLRRENIDSKNKIDYFDLREDRVNFYLSVGTEVSTISYRAKAIASGDFKLLPLSAKSMYETDLEARGQESTIYIEAQE